MRSSPWLALAALLAAPAAAAPLVVYTDTALASGWDNWSWATVSFADASAPHAGTSAIRVTAGSYQAVFAHRGAGIDTTTYGTLDLWLRGAAGAHVSVALVSGGSRIGAGGEWTFDGAWQHASLAFEQLGVAAGDAADGLWLQEDDGSAQTFFADDVQILARTSPPPPPPPGSPVTVTVDPSADRRAISPDIYGVNFGDDAQAAALHWPVRRWGGNSTSRYNWRVDVHSVGSDWYYFNYTNIDPAPPNLPDGSSADLFIDATRASGGEPIMTVPLIGWTPIEDRVRRWSFPVSVYGPQQETECSRGSADWCNPDAGNGVAPNGALLAPVPTRTSQPIDASFVTEWMAHIAGRVGDAGHGGVRLFALDNEPALWNSTHRDVHPNPTTYDELWAKTQTIASAVKAQDPNAQLLGPVSWGWCEYFFSAADGCGDGGDRVRHGDEAWIDWYLDQARLYETAHGVRLVDYLDLHYYPQNNGVALSNDESVATQAMRLRSLKSLYDPTYVDESWIGSVIRMIPRMRDWVANHYPGTKLAITEYSWGSDDGSSSALAQAEALAIFGREGLDLATRWIAPAPGSRVEDAFRLYLDANGTGKRLDGTSVRAASSDVDAVGSYAIESSNGRRAYLLFNKDTQPRQATVSLVAGPITGAASLTRFDATHRIGFVGNSPAVDGALELDLPARSATLAVIEPPAPSAATGFYTVAPCRLVDTRNAASALGGPSLAANVPRAFPVAGQCGVPSNAVALSLNVTAVGAGGAGALRVYGADIAIPLAESVSFAAGGTRATNAVVSLARDGSGAIAVYSPVAVDVVIDVNGYFR